MDLNIGMAQGPKGHRSKHRVDLSRSKHEHVDLSTSMEFRNILAQEHQSNKSWYKARKHARKTIKHAGKQNKERTC